MQVVSSDVGQGSRDRSYWLTRQWAYQSMLPRSAVPAEPARTETGSAGETVSTPASPQVVRALAGLKIEPNNVVCYGEHRTTIRPTARQLLGVMCTANGAAAIEAVSRSLWRRGTPPTHNTLRTTIFRANTALRALQCPLHLSVRGTELVLKWAAPQ